MEINKCVTAVKVSNFSGHYLRNRSTLDIGVLGYIGIVQHKEHSPEVLSIPPGTPCIFSIASRSIILRMRTVSDKIFTEKLNTYFMFNNVLFILNRAIYELMWQSKIEPDWPHMKI